MSMKADGKNEADTDWFKDNYIKYDHLPLKGWEARRSYREPGSGGPDASYMTGSVVTVDGGLTITF